MHEDVRKYADSNDIKGLRYIFVDCLDVDPTFEKYAEDFEYCKKKAGLFDPHRELMPMTENQSVWNDDYWVQLKMDLLKNFSYERFEHMRQVALVYYAEKIARITKERKERERQLEERNRQVMQERMQSQNERPQESEPVQENVTGGVESAGRSQREEQERRLAEKRRQLEQERQRSLERERREKEQLEKRRADDRKTTSSSMENFDSKKVVGVVLVVVIIIVILLIIVTM